MKINPKNVKEYLQSFDKNITGPTIVAPKIEIILPIIIDYS
jgi:hypothetical protein